MINKYVREIRHIIANYSLRNNATAYHIDSRSLTFKIIRDLIRRNWIEPKYVNGQFLFVSPADILKKVFRTSEIKNKVSAVPVLSKKFIWKNHTENYHVKSPVVIAA
jgi:hypothetical protein